MKNLFRKLFGIKKEEKITHKVVIKTGLYKESKSKRKPIYTTEIKSNNFGGTHYTLENLIKDKISIPEVTVYYGTNGDERSNLAKKFIITIEEDEA